jgi:glucokinase
MNDRLLLGIEIGGTKLQIGAGRGDGTLVALERLTVNPSNGAEGIRSQIVSATRALLARLDADPDSIGAVGIGFGGPVDATDGVVTLSNQIDGWAGFPLAEWARQTLGVPRVSLQNDADTAALGEARFGAGVGASPVLYVTVGSGIGGGLVVDGRIYRGAGRGALEIGHLIVEEGDSPRTLESIASGWSIGRDAATVVARALQSGLSSEESPLLHHCHCDPARATAAIVALAADDGDPLALRLLQNASTAVAKALAHAVTLLAPERIILGGGVSLMSDPLWLHPIREQVETRVFPPFRKTYDIVPPLLGEEVVVHGALALALDLAHAR